jgi:hypothetical protein
MDDGVSVLVHVEQLVKKNRIDALILLKDVEELVVLRNNVLRKEVGLFVKDKIVAFQVKQVIFLDVAFVLKVFLNYKSHVAETQVDKISKDDEVVVILIHSHSICKSKVFILNKIVQILITF